MSALTVMVTLRQLELAPVMIRLDKADAGEAFNNAGEK